MIPTPRLACEQCKQRKKRCNKESPCSACKKMGLQCHTVQRTRLPRGRSSKKQAYNAMLENRVERIEAILAQQAAVAGTACPPVSATSSSTGSEKQTPLRVPGGQMSNFVAPEFWTALSDEICGLREILENSNDQDEDRPETDYTTNTQEAESSHELTSKATIIFSHFSNVDANRPVLRSPELARKLLLLFRSRVDSVYKIVHWPTTVSMIKTQHDIPAGACETQSVKCLEWSIYFMAMCSISDNESQEIGLGRRLDVLRTYRCTVEGLFAQSHLLRNPDLVLLQAFVIYLIGLRTCSNGADTWTLVAVAARAATALRLGNESARTHSPFDIELRRRLLFAIGILDTHSALDRGTVPILPSAVFRNPPLRINDHEMTPHSVPGTSSNGHTDMSHTAMIYEAMICQRKLYELSQSTHDVQEHWHQKLELIDAFKTYVMNNSCAPESSDDPLQNLQRISGNRIHASLELLLRRPPYPQSRNTVPPWDFFDVLDAATEVLEQHLQPLSPGFEPWAWKNWVQWHALAVVLAELTVRPEGPLSDRAYSIATKSFQHYSSIVADSASGTLWKPIARLMCRVWQVRNSTPSDAALASSGVEVPLYDQSDSSTNLFDTDIIPGMDFSDLMNCSIEIEGPDGVSGFGKSPHLGYNNIGDENRMPWSAWDAFIQDLSY